MTKKRATMAVAKQTTVSPPELGALLQAFVGDMSVIARVSKASTTEECETFVRLLYMSCAHLKLLSMNMPKEASDLADDATLVLDGLRNTLAKNLPREWQCVINGLEKGGDNACVS